MEILKYLLVVSLCTVTAVVSKDCAIRIPGDLPAPPYFTPVIVIPSGNAFVLAPKDSSGVIRVPDGGSIYLSCYGNGFTGFNVNELKATCVGGIQFSYNTKMYTFGQLSCYSIPNSERRRRAVTPDCQTAGGDVTVDIGFHLNLLPDMFFSTIEICFNDAQKKTLWSKYRATGGHEAGKAPSEDFNTHDFFFNLNPNIPDGYKQKTQASSFGQKTTLDEGIFFFTEKNYLNRGHLTANSDFTLLSHRASTYCYINVAPQWKAFNAGSWGIIEEDVRKYVNTRTQSAPDLVTQVITGTHGMLKLTRRTNPQVNPPVEVYLTSFKSFPIVPTKALTPAVPAPKFYWKVVHDPAAKKGVIIIGVNNPYESNVADPALGYQLCKDKVTVNWIKPWAGDLVRGYYYVCKVNDVDLIKAIPFLRTIDVTNGLLPNI